MDPEQQRADVILAASAAQEPMVCGLVWGFSCEIIERGYGKTFYFHDPNPDKPEPNRRFRTCSALGRTILDDLPIHIRPDLPAARVQTPRTQWVQAIMART